MIKRLSKLSCGYMNTNMFNQGTALDLETRQDDGIIRDRKALCTCRYECVILELFFFLLFDLIQNLDNCSGAFTSPKS